eukprot:Rmarinus@m.4737
MVDGLTAGRRRIAGRGVACVVTTGGTSISLAATEDTRARTAGSTTLTMRHVPAGEAGTAMKGETTATGEGMVTSPRWITQRMATRIPDTSMTILQGAVHRMEATSITATKSVVDMSDGIRVEAGRMVVAIKTRRTTETFTTNTVTAGGSSAAVGKVAGRENPKTEKCDLCAKAAEPCPATRARSCDVQAKEILFKD